ncbi:hypothetical protein BaRGS_00000291 [Batillaria attramentaria]|uniref:Uncharacterized protein n=1 Tax=Batillaria attramentaria TaxID=370345 RepID=A0ABD0MC16_9CAEN
MVKLNGQGAELNSKGVDAAQWSRRCCSSVVKAMAELRCKGADELNGQGAEFSVDRYVVARACMDDSKRPGRLDRRVYVEPPKIVAETEDNSATALTDTATLWTLAPLIAWLMY